MRRFASLLVVCVLLGTLLVGCGGSAATSSQSNQNVAAETGGNDANGALMGQAGAPAPTVAASGAGGATGSGSEDQTGAAGVTPPQNVAFADDPNRKIIKNGDVTLEIEEGITIGINRITGIAAENGGYVLQVQSADQSGAMSTATVGIAVPVDRFEAVMERIRTAGKRVVSEQASGQDVSQEFVDTQTQIDNLEATLLRVRQFLDRAANVEEALSVNRQLTELEGQISQLKGRLQFLSQRAAYSTITVQLQHLAVATPEPTPTVVPWNAQATVAQATTTLRGVLQGFATAAIWLSIVILPLVLPFVLVWLLLRALRGRAGSRGRGTAVTSTDETPRQGATP